MAALILAFVLAASPAVPFVPLPPGELRGQVMRRDGAPVPRFTVNNVAFDDPQGMFKILTPPEGEFRVVIRAEGYAPNVFHVVGASGKKLWVPEIKLGDGEHVLGEVVDADTELAIPSARASLADPAKIERLRFIRPERVAGLGVTGEGGYFELKKVPRGLLVLVVQHPDYLPEFVPVNTRAPLPQIRLHRGGSVTGTVRDPNGGTLSRARVVVISEDAGDGAETNADLLGRFKIEKLRPGRYRVIAVRGGKLVEAGEVGVVDGQVSKLGAGSEPTPQIRKLKVPKDLPTIEIGLGPEPRSDRFDTREAERLLGG